MDSFEWDSGRRNSDREKTKSFSAEAGAGVLLAFTRALGVSALLLGCAPPGQPAPPAPAIAVASSAKAITLLDLNRLALRLGGVVIEGGTASALIKVGDQPLRAFQVGQVIEGGVRVKTIAFDHVVVEAPGQKRTLAFAPQPAPSEPLADVKLEASRDAIARVAYAEAANQGDAGLAAVVYTILNRLRDGRWGLSVDAVLNAPGQFEPVGRAGGDWRLLPAIGPAGRARIDTILNLALEGHLPDLTGGARFFQNPAIVAKRASAGTVSPKLVNFGGSAPSRVIGAHAFYAEGFSPSP